MLPKNLKADLVQIEAILVVLFVPASPLIVFLTNLGASAKIISLVLSAGVLATFVIGKAVTDSAATTPPPAPK